MATAERPPRSNDTSAWTSAAEAMYRAAQAVAGSGNMSSLVRKLAHIMQVPAVFVAVFTDGTQRTLRTLAAVLDGKLLTNFDYPLEGSPCAQVVGRAFRFVASGVAAEFRPGTIFAAKGMDSYAAFPLADAAGQPLGLLVAMDRKPIADANLAEALLKIFASRVIAEIERSSSDDALRAAALAVSAASGESVFAELVRYLATILHVEMAFISRYRPEGEGRLHMLAMVSDGELLRDLTYPVKGMPCEYVLGRHFQAFPAKLHERFSLNGDVRLSGAEGYAGLPLNDAQGRALGTIGIVSRTPLANVERIESMLRIFAGRAAAEIEQLEAREALQGSEASYRAIFDGSVDSMVLWSKDLRTIDVNQAFVRMTGMARDEVVGRHWTERPDSQDMVRLIGYIEAALQGRETQAVEPVTRADGATFHIELRYLPVHLGDTPYVLGVGRDVSERIRNEAALRASEAQYRGIFNASADALVLRAADFSIVDANATYERMSGFRLSEVLGIDRVLANPPEIAATIRALHAKALAGEPIHLETELVRRDGERYALELRGVPFEHHGEPHVLYIGRDMTQSKRAEAEHERLEAQLRQAQKMEAIGQLTGGIAHDFNNILTSVIGYLALAQERAENLGDTRLQHQLSQAHLAAQRARDLIAQMLAFARRQRGQRRTLALGPLVGQTLQLLRATLPSSVSLDFVPPAAPLGGELHADVDAVHLEQVLFNLCINARDAITGSGWIRVRLGRNGGGWTCASCRTRVDAGRWVELSVADSGSGIPPELIDRIFEPFTSSKEVGQGSGMGLAMVHGIVHDHGGHVLVATTPAAGSEFRVLLPQAGAPALEGADASAPVGASESLCARVMIVDDEAMVGDFMIELLSGWGIDVVLQRNPLQALAWLEDPAQPLDLMITDQTMPQLDGLQLAQRATTLRPGLPVLLYTGNADGVDEALARRHGIRDVLRKPVDHRTLRALLASHLRSMRARTDPGR